MDDLFVQTDAAAPSAAPDLVAIFIAAQRSDRTRHAYARDLAIFFGWSGIDSGSAEGGAQRRAAVRAFVALPRAGLLLRLLEFKGQMNQKKLAPATVNRRLSTICALLHLANQLDLCVSNGRGLVSRERVKTYRDVRGVGLDRMRELVVAAESDRGDLRGRRDKAIFGVALELGLRNSEMRNLDVADLDGARLRVTRKGALGQAVYQDVPSALVSDLRAYLEASGHKDGALFRSLDHKAKNGRISENGLRAIIARVGDELGIHLTPHKLRHSSISAARHLTGDLFALASFSGHAQVETLKHYIDDRGSDQGNISQALSDLLRENPRSTDPES